MEIVLIPVIALIPGCGRDQHSRLALHITVRRYLPQVTVIIPQILNGGTGAGIICNRLAVGTDNTDAAHAFYRLLSLLQPVIYGVESNLPFTGFPFHKDIYIFYDLIIHIDLIYQVGVNVHGQVHPFRELGQIVHHQGIDLAFQGIGIHPVSNELDGQNGDYGCHDKGKHDLFPYFHVIEMVQ